MRLLILGLLLLHTHWSLCQAPVARTKFSADEARADFDYLYETLQKTHYNLFINTEKKVYDQAYRNMRNGITDSLDLLQLTRIFQPFTALSGLAHCNVAYPFATCYGPYIENKGTLFPLEIKVNGNRVYISHNYTDNPQLRAGDELLSIDNMPAARKIQGIYDYLSGENDYFKNTLIDLLTFPRAYWMVYDRQDTFQLSVLKHNGQLLKCTVKAIPAADFEAKEGQRSSVFNQERMFTLMDDVAWLRPGPFMNTTSTGNTSEHNTFEKGSFVHFIDSSFSVIRRSKVKSLVIDLRGNPGGDNSFSDAMLAYIADKPFWFCSKFMVKTSAITKKFWKDVKDSSLADLRNKILHHEDGTIIETAIGQCAPKPDSLRFHGKVFALIDRYSYSNTVTTAAIIQDYRFGKLIGEPTADVPTTYGAIHQFQLPHSGLAVSYPKAFMVRSNGDETVKGVTPDIRAGADTTSILKIVHGDKDRDTVRDRSRVRIRERSR